MNLCLFGQLGGQSKQLPIYCSNLFKCDSESWGSWLMCLWLCSLELERKFPENQEEADPHRDRCLVRSNFLQALYLQETEAAAADFFFLKDGLYSFTFWWSI